MRYLCLLYASEDDREGVGPRARRRVHDRYGGLERELREAGILTDAAELRPAATATTIRVREGETIVTDGPFAETREQLDGFFVLDCESLEEVEAIARRLPAAEHGAVEVRPQHVKPEP